MTKKVKHVKKIVKKLSLERERVNYNFDSKRFAIQAQFKQHRVDISKAQVLELVARKDDLKRFYSYCNADIQLLRRLHADAHSKKIHEVVNTQYDSRKKLLRLVIHVALTVLKQKAKTAKKTKHAKS